MRRSTWQWLLVVVALVLVACTATPATPMAPAPTPTAAPAASATPTPAPTLAATPTPTPAAPLISPIVTGASIRVGGWSPDGQWLTFWMAETHDPTQPNYPCPKGALHFYNARTREMCACPEFQTSQCFGMSLAWQDDGQVVVWDGATAKRGRPCQGSFQVTDAEPRAGMTQAASLSPGGSYRATTAEERAGDVRIRVTTTFASARTGQTVQVIEYVHRGGEGSLGLGGVWVIDSLFLISETIDRGPLLVDVRQGRVVEVLPELFGVMQAPTQDLGFRAEAKAVAGSDTYHIVLSVGRESAYPPLRFYHSETGEVEALESRYPWWPAFSPDGRWLLVDARPQHPRAGTDLLYQSYALWARPVDPAGSAAHLIADGDYPAFWSWSPGWVWVAVPGLHGSFGLPNVISVYSFPEGRLLNSWATGEYQAQPYAWSPDRQRLAMSGNVPGERKYGLFIVEP